MLGFPLVMLTSSQSTFKKSCLFLVTVLGLGGVVATQSRGGFVGLVALLTTMYLRSSSKLLLAFITIPFALLSVFFVPQEYWNEMATIQNYNEGTGHERIKTWHIAMDAWLDPPNFPFGRGYNNAPWLLGHYEPKFNQTVYGKSVAGRAVHSTLFQLLPDTGLAGLCIFGGLMWLCIIGNFKHRKRLRLTQRDIQEHYLSVTQEANSSSKNLQNLYKASIRQLDYSRYFLEAINTSFIGTLVAALGVSALYYPPIWLLVVLSIAAQKHSVNMQKNITSLLQFKK